MLQNTFKFFIPLLVVILGVCSTPVWGTRLSVPPLKAKPGQKIDMPLMIDQIEKLAGVKLVIKYDAALLTFVKATKTAQTTSLMHIVNDRTPGILIVVMAGAQGISGKNFPLLNLTFMVTKDIHKGSTTELQVTESQFMSEDLKDIPATIQIAPLTIVIP